MKSTKEIKLYDVIAYITNINILDVPLRSVQLDDAKLYLAMQRRTNRYSHILAIREVLK